MNRKLIWRAVTSASVSCPGHDEVHVFVEAADYEEAKKHLYDRLEEEWQLPVSHITFHNVWNENELCEMSAGPKVPSGLPLLESGGGNGEVFYDHNPLLLIASQRLRAVIEGALSVLPERGEQDECGRGI